MRKWAIKLFLALTAIESMVVAVIIYVQRSPIEGYFLNTGLTGKNFLLLSVAILISVLAIGLLVIIQKDQTKFGRMTGILENDKWYIGIISLSVLILIECVQDFLFISSNIKSPYYFDYLQLLFSLIPFLCFGVLFSIQSLLLFTILRIKDNPIFKLISAIETPWLLGFSALSLIFILFSLSGYGFVPNTNHRLTYLVYGHLEPTPAALIGEQVFIVLGVVLIIFLLIQLLGKISQSPQKSKYIDWIIILMVWIIAYQLWINIPIEQNFFTDVSGSPNDTIYPISDAFFFDSESLSILNKGEFFDRTTHVLYSFFLAILHKLRGPDFLDIIGMQIGFLALTPVLLYKLTSKLHTKFTGVLVAILYIIRERNGLQLSNVLSGTVVSQLMSEPYGVLVTIAFLYLIIEWLQQKEKRSWIPILAGSVMGLSLLIRAELLAILLAVSITTLIYLWKDKKRWILGMIQLWAVTGLIIIPWMSRNYVRNGIFSLDKGSYVQKRILEYAGSLSTIFNNDNQEIPEVDPVLDPVITDPNLIPYIPDMNDVPNHFISNIWHSVLYLPSSHQPLFTFSNITPGLFENYQVRGGIFSKEYAENYVRSLPYYWYYWDGRIENRSILSISFLLLFISIGAWRVWKKDSIIVLILPFAFLSHMLLWSFAGLSGGRFTKPSDWVSLVFYGIGLAEVTFFFMRYFLGSMHASLVMFKPEVVKEKLYNNWKPAWIVLSLSGFFIILGLAPVLSEIILPEKFTKETMESSLAKISKMDQDNNASLLSCYIDEINGSSSPILYGKALYPRYFAADETLEDDRSWTLPDSDNPRLDHYLLGEQNIWVSLPLNGPQTPFSHYSDVIVLGEVVRNLESDNKTGDKPYFEAKAIYIINLSDPGGLITKVSKAGPDCDL